MPIKLRTLTLITGLAAVLALAGCQSGSKGQPEAAGPSPESGTVLPGLDGTDVTLEQYQGKVVLVNFWATWCAPCLVEIPWLIEFDQKYGPEGLVILGIAMDDGGKKVVEPWVKDRRFDVNGQSVAISYQIVLGDDKIADSFGSIIGLPTSMLYSREGKKIKTIIGLINHDDLSNAIEDQF